MKQVIFWAGLALCFMKSLPVFAQAPVTFKSKDNDTIRTVYIWHSDTLREVKKDSVSIQSLFGHVKLQQEQTIFYCDSVAMNQASNIVEAFGNVHINDHDTTNIYSQYMKYFVDKKYIIFQKKVSLTDGKGVLTTEELQYDLNQRIGNYTSGGKVTSGSTIVTSQDGTYYAETKDVYFKKNVVLKDPAYDLTTDSLLYNTQSQLATFITQTYIRDSTGRTIRTKEGYYDMHSHKAQFGKRPHITDGSQSIVGDDVQFDDSTGISIARGNAVFRDTAQNLSVIANLMIANKKTNTLLATQRPLMIIKQDKDSLYVTADTLFSGQIPDSVIARHDSLAQQAAIEQRDSATHKDSTLAPKDSLNRKDSALAQKNPIARKDSAITQKDSLNKKDSALAQKNPIIRKDSALAQKNPVTRKDSAFAQKDTSKRITSIAPGKRSDSSRRYIQGFHHVRIFSDSLQGVADSLYYSGIDSVFQLFTDPVLWASGRQITGDTIFLYTKNKKPERLYVFENGLAVSKTGNNMYDQVKGNTLNGYFKNGEMDYMRAKGSAESVYYIKDDSLAFVGVNKVNKADIIDMIFLDKGLNKVVLRNDADGIMYPIRQANIDDMRLRNFKWLEDKRPKSKFELFEEPVRVENKKEPEKNEPEPQQPSSPPVFQPQP
jgi:lipopolysaccharide export system protein LptA